MLDAFSQEILKSLKVLRQGEILLYPTDTVWGIGCDPTRLKTVRKIYKIKGRSIEKSMILLVNSYQMLERIVRVSQPARKLMNKTSHPLTIVYDHPIGVFSTLSSNDGTLAVRLTRDLFCRKLIRAFGGPLISTSANFSGSPTPLFYDQISPNILEAVDYIVNLRRKDKATYLGSSIVRYRKEENWEVLRK